MNIMVPGLYSRIEVMRYPVSPTLANNTKRSVFYFKTLFLHTTVHIRQLLRTHNEQIIQVRASTRYVTFCDDVKQREHRDKRRRYCWRSSEWSLSWFNGVTDLGILTPTSQKHQILPTRAFKSSCSFRWTFGLSSLIVAQNDCYQLSIVLDARLL